MPRTSALPALGVAALLATAPALTAQDTPKRSPALADATKDLEKTLKDRKAARDAEATAIIKRLAQSYGEGMHPKDQRMVTKAIAKAFKVRPLRPPNASIYRSATDAMAVMGDAGARVLQQAYESGYFPHKEPWVPVRAHFLKRMGETRSKPTANFLAEVVQRAPEDDLLAAAGEALRHYAKADQRLRKELVKRLVNKLGGLESTASQPRVNEPNSPQYYGAATASRTLRKVRKPFLTTLTALTGQKHANGTEWQHWYNKNKARNWDR